MLRVKRSETQGTVAKHNETLRNPKRLCPKNTIPGRYLGIEISRIIHIPTRQFVQHHTA